VTNGVSSNEHARRQQRLSTSWEYRRESVSCRVTFAQYTSLLEFVVPSLEFHRVLWFLNILLNKTPWDQRRKNSFGLRTFRVTNGLQERTKPRFYCTGKSVYRNYIYIMINFIWLHVSTRNESYSGHLNLLLWPISYYKWNVSSLQDPIRLYNGYTDKTYFKSESFGKIT
jgi:hypothetical protein